MQVCYISVRCVICSCVAFPLGVLHDGMLNFR